MCEKHLFRGMGILPMRHRAVPVLQNRLAG